MDALLTSIERCLESENWHAAIALSLALPDICARLENPANKGKPAYFSWFDRHLQQVYEAKIGGEVIRLIGAADFYALRCAYLHAGMDDISAQPINDELKRIQFAVTGSHRIKFAGVLVLHPRIFCQEVIAAVRSWRNEVRDNVAIAARINALAKIEKGTFSPAPGLRVG